MTSSLLGPESFTGPQECEPPGLFLLGVILAVQLGALDGWGEVVPLQRET